MMIEQILVQEPLHARQRLPKESYVSLHVVDLVTSNKNQTFASSARMAEAIIEVIYQRGDCTPQDLRERGFALDEICEKWHRAQSMAAIEINLLCEYPTSLKSILRR